MIELYIAIVAGAVINLLLGLNEAVAKPDYHFNIFFKENIIATVLNIITGCIIVYAREDPIVKSVLNVTFLSAVFIGSAGQFYWKKIKKIFDPDEETYISNNG